MNKKEHFFTIYERKSIERDAGEIVEDDVFLLESTSIQEISEKLKKWGLIDKTAEQLKSNIARGRSIMDGFNSKILIYKDLGVKEA